MTSLCPSSRMRVYLCTRFCVDGYFILEVWRYCSSGFWLPLFFYSYVHITSFPHHCFEVLPFLKWIFTVISLGFDFMYSVWGGSSSLYLKNHISLNPKSFQTLFLWEFCFPSFPFIFLFDLEDISHHLSHIFSPLFYFYLCFSVILEIFLSFLWKHFCYL